MICETPTKFFMVTGSSEGYTELNSFDGALLNAGIGNTNLVKMSSIVPPNCKEIEPVKLPYGALVPVAYAAITSDLEGEVISAAIATALPKDPSKPGLIMEYSSRGRRKDIEKIVRKMAEEGMKVRSEEVAVIKSVSVEHEVKKIGTAFASVVLWY
jgi:arginine decarboxylase